jgi:hypothetical protein
MLCTVCCPICTRRGIYENCDDVYLTVGGVFRPAAAEMSEEYWRHSLRYETCRLPDGLKRSGT